MSRTKAQEEAAYATTYADVSTEEFKDLVRDAMTHGLRLYAESSHPGVGKTEIVYEIAKEVSTKIPTFKAVPMHLAVLDIGDLVMKIPIKDRQDKYALEEIVAQFLPRDHPFCLFIDECRHGEQTVRFMCYRLILEGKLGSTYTMPEGSSIIACSNATHDTDTEELDGPLITRFDLKANLVTTWKDFEKYALSLNNVLAMFVIGFHRFSNGKYLTFRNQNLGNRCELNPRVWVKLITMGCVKDVEDLKKYSKFCLPVGIALQFNAFVEQMELYSKDVRDYVKGKIAFPEEIDKQAAIMTSIIAYLEREKDFEQFGGEVLELKMKGADEEIKSVIIVQTLRTLKRRKSMNLRKLIAGKNGPAIMATLQEYRFIVDDDKVAVAPAAV